MKKVDLGCGISKKPGYLGVDHLNLPTVDIVHDLNVFPYPFADNEVDELWMDQVLEHMADPIKTMHEIHRICRHDAKIFIGVPYFRSFYAAIDPTHRNFFGVQWFNYFDPRHDFYKKYQYFNIRFRVEKVIFDREMSGQKLGLVHRSFLALANKRPLTYEARLSHLYPLSSLTFHLQVDKS